MLISTSPEGITLFNPTSDHQRDDPPIKQITSFPLSLRYSLIVSTHMISMVHQLGNHMFIHIYLETIVHFHSSSIIHYSILFFNWTMASRWQRFPTFPRYSLVTSRSRRCSTWGLRSMTELDFNH